MRRSAVCVPLLACLAANSSSTPIALTAPMARIAPNDNRHSAGTLANGVLTLHLEARTGAWRPDRDAGVAITTAAFAEVGHELQTPGPLIRVPVGTEVHATVRNGLTKPMWLHGMGAHRGMGDSTAIAPNEVRDLRFRATEPGAYYYAARTDTLAIFARLQEDSQLGGVIIVDPPGLIASRNERILAITSWFTFDPHTVSGLGNNATITFNGLAWPATERLSYTQGDTVRFRIVNMSVLDHPLHLHGFYYNVEAKGDGQRDTLYAAEERRSVVTEYMAPMATMSMSWIPARAGNWIFHCHFASHITPHAGLEADRGDMTPHAGPASMTEHMRGLVMGITVKPRGPQVVASGPARPIRLLVRSKAAVYGKYVGYSFVLGGSPDEANRDAMPVPGPLLNLTRGERVAITIVNQSHDQAAVHWHGIELESYPDGVPGWSGAGTNVMPSIAPGESLTVKFTPPRAGTFMYHSHSNEMQQIGSGLYGAIIVSEPGAQRDSLRDRVMLISDGGPVTSFIDATTQPPPLVNGQLAPRPVDIRGGEPVRFRLINIRTENPMVVSLLENDSPVQWRLVAKDGMPTRPGQRGLQSARLSIAPGEIYDMEVSLRAGSMFTMRYETPALPPTIMPPLEVVIRAR